jgi:putative ABC transport system ATP-binding protein
MAQALVLEARGLAKRYEMGEHAVAALIDVDFAVAKGEFVAIMGPSGSGKSTLLHLLGGLEKPSAGEILLGGRRLAEMNDDQVTLTRRRHIGFVFQFFHLLPTLTAEENVGLPVIIDGKDLRQYKQRMEALFNLVGLSDRRSHRPEQLSGGEQQRVALARALLTEPDIVLADEPTGNLDTKTGTAIMELLRRSCDEFGQTIVAVTHDPKAAAYADRVVFLRDGRVVTSLQLDQKTPTSQRLRAVLGELEQLEV